MYRVILNGVFIIQHSFLIMKGLNKMISNIFWFIYFMSIFTIDLSSITNTQIGNIAIILSLIYIIFRLINSPNTLIVTRKFILLFFSLIILSLFSLIINDNVNYINLFRAVKLNLFMLFYYVGLNIAPDKKEIYRILSISYFAFILILFIQNENILSSLFIQRRILYMNFLWFKIYTGNLFAMTLVFMVWITLTQMDWEEKRYLNLLRIISLILTGPVIIAIYSRTAFIIMFVLFVYYILKQQRKFKPISKIYYIVGAVVFIFVFMYFMKDTSIAERIQYTFGGGSMGGKVDNSTYSRILIIKNLLEYFMSNAKVLLFGTGFEEYEDIVSNFGFIFTSAHNGFLNIWFKAGLLYLITIILFMSNSIIRKRKTDKNNLFGLKEIIVIFIISNLTAEAFSYFMYFELFFLIYGMNDRELRLGESIKKINLGVNYDKGKCNNTCI